MWRSRPLRSCSTRDMPNARLRESTHTQTPISRTRLVMPQRSSRVRVDREAAACGQLRSRARKFARGCSVAVALVSQRGGWTSRDPGRAQTPASGRLRKPRAQVVDADAATVPTHRLVVGDRPMLLIFVQRVRDQRIRGFDGEPGCSSSKRRTDSCSDPRIADRHLANQREPGRRCSTGGELP